MAEAEEAEAEEAEGVDSVGVDSETEAEAGAVMGAVEEDGVRGSVDAGGMEEAVAAAAVWVADSEKVGADLVEADLEAEAVGLVGEGVAAVD